MSESQLSFYPVTQDQVTDLQGALRAFGFKVELAGNTFAAKGLDTYPDVEATAGYIEEQQTLLVTVTHGPFFPIEAVKSWMGAALVTNGAKR